MTHMILNITNYKFLGNTGTALFEISALISNKRKMYLFSFNKNIHFRDTNSIKSFRLNFKNIMMFRIL